MNKKIKASASPPRILTSERPGGSGTSEDRIFLTQHAVIVLDGATSVELGPGSGGWYADCLGRHLEEHIVSDQEEDLRKLLAEAIQDISREYGLAAGRSPSSTVAILRWDDQHIEALVLGDSTVAVLDRSGGSEVLHDSRISDVPNEKRTAYLEQLRGGDGYRSKDSELVRSFQAITRAHRNQEGGYWIAEAFPEAAFHAHTQRWERAALTAAVVATDGVSCAVDDYHLLPDWSTALGMILGQGPDALLDSIHEAEESDPDARRWPRFKPHDDKAVAAVLFDS